MTPRAQGMEWAEKVAKTLFDLTHCVSDIHEVGWPRWASEVDKRKYRLLAAWHVKRIKAQKARSVRVVRTIRTRLVTHNISGVHNAKIELCNDILTALQRGRGGKG